MATITNKTLFALSVLALWSSLAVAQIPPGGGGSSSNPFTTPSNLTGLTATTTPVSTDILYIVVDPSGTPLARKVTVGNLFANQTLTGLLKLPPTTTTMSGNVTLTSTSNSYQNFDPNGSNRDVTLPTAADGMMFFINHVGSANTLTVKNAAAATVATITNGSAGVFQYDGTASVWRVLSPPAAMLLSTSLTTPLIIGGTTTTSALTFRTTTGVGTTNADMIFQVGNNGATEAMRILNSGFVGIGLAAPLTKLHTSGTTFSAAAAWTLQGTSASTNGEAVDYPAAILVNTNLTNNTGVGLGFDVSANPATQFSAASIYAKFTAAVASSALRGDLYLQTRGADGNLPRLSIVGGQIQILALKTTGAATGKTVVCVDTSTGQLYASTSGVACAN